MFHFHVCSIGNENSGSAQMCRFQEAWSGRIELSKVSVKFRNTVKNMMYCENETLPVLWLQSRTTGWELPMFSRRNNGIGEKRAALFKQGTDVLLM